MRFEILNVEHGFAAYAQAMDGSVLLFDCGYSRTCRPSDYLWGRGIQTIRRLFITNYDEDHISDLSNLLRRMHIEILTRNPTLTSAQLRSLKSPRISSAMESLLGMINTYTGYVADDQLEPQGLKVWTFQNSYPSFADTNNLSVLTFLDVGEISFVLPGDLERAGWLELLKDPHVRGLLGRVNVFVASHHGRENGYCREVFEYCKPRFVVFSDGAIEYETQQMAGIYGEHATGGSFNAAHGIEFRKVLSTRKDGNLAWEC